MILSTIMENTASDTPLAPSGGDWVHTAAKVAISAIPVAGGPAAELFAAVFTPPITKRRDAWIASIAEGVARLQQQVGGLEQEKLSQNEVFVTTAMHASQMAVRNHQREKLEALRNAVMNAALPNAPEEDKQQMFLTFVDGLTVSHLQVLKFCADPDAWCSERGSPWSKEGRYDKKLIRAFPEFGDRHDFADQIHKDLDSRGLICRESLHGAIILLGDPAKVTEFGKEFLAFITSPF